MDQKRIWDIVGKLTLEEKAGLCSGQDNWFTKAIERLEIPAVRTSDGPHGLRTQDGGVNSMSEEATIPATCYPAACATAASFDTDLMERMGQQLGKECQALGVNVILGPGLNIKRSPLCGRNFEYFSEDPYLSGMMGTAYVKGIQKEGVGACVKHFFANSQEHRRMDSSSEMDERTMREIYLPAFERVVKEAQPWMVMASYNKIGGTYATECRQYLNDLLREEWGFAGAVTSDWGATHNRAAVTAAGCDLTMPAEDTDDQLGKAVREGALDEAALDACCARVIELAFKAAEHRQKDVTFDYEAGDALAKEVSSESMVLLKNEGSILPLSADASVAFIGGFAENPRYQGGGSSHIKSTKVTSALQAAEAEGYSVKYAQGYRIDTMDPDEELIKGAVEIAKTVDIAVVFAGLTDQMESEGIDRRHMKMCEAQNKLIASVCAVNPNTVVVLYNGAPIEMPWVDKPKAILEAYLGGQAVGAATVEVLYGKVNPSGHLPETFPKKLSDNPSHLFYFGEGDKVQYAERIFVGYRYYTAKELEPLFPFGYGLSYTNFTYDGLTLDKSSMEETDTLHVSVSVANTGAVGGKALVQFYIAPPRNEVIRPIRELKAFQKVYLEPGERKTVQFDLHMRDFAHWSEEYHDWRVEDGVYSVQICADADHVLTQANVKIHATRTLRPVHYSMDMNMGEFVKTPMGYKIVDENIAAFVHGMAEGGMLPPQAVAALEQIGGGQINLSTVNLMAEHMNIAATGSNGIDVLFSQPVSILSYFLPKEKTEEIIALMEQLNREDMV